MESLSDSCTSIAENREEVNKLFSESKIFCCDEINSESFSGISNGTIETINGLLMADFEADATLSESEP